MKTIAAAVLLAVASVTSSATARAENVPTVDQVTALMAELTDAGIPSANKGDALTPPFTDQEARKIDYWLNFFRGWGTLPFNFIVSDIQPAPNNMAGATVANGGTFHTRADVAPIVLTNQGGRWMVTHDSALDRTNMLFKDSWHTPAGI